jgi:hypothetical protein
MMTNVNATRRRVGPLRLLVALYGAPLAWVAQMSLSEPLAAQACYPGGRPLSSPAWPPLQTTLALISGACLVAALASALVAWSVWRAVRDERVAGDGRPRFLAVLGLMSAGLFVAAVLFTALAVVLIAPCAGTV